jgi:hypothetical protein
MVDIFVNIFECRSSGPGSSIFVILCPAASAILPSAVCRLAVCHISRVTLAERKTRHAPPDSVPYAIKGNDKAVSRANQEASWLRSGIKPTWISPSTLVPPTKPAYHCPARPAVIPNAQRPPRRHLHRLPECAAKFRASPPSLATLRYAKLCIQRRNCFPRLSTLYADVYRCHCRLPVPAVPTLRLSSAQLPFAHLQ